MSDTKLFEEIPAETKDEIFDLVNQTFHDGAFVWQTIEQGDPEEALDTIEAIKSRCDEILEKLNAHRLPPAAPEFKVGDQVEITAVAYPSDPRHARFVGQMGTIKRIFKTRPCADVETSIGNRECQLKNLKLVP